MIVKTSKGDLPIRYSWNALRRISADLGMTMNDIMELDLMNRPGDDVFTFVLHGFKEGARLDGAECKVDNLDDVGDLLSEDVNVLAKCIEAFAEDMKATREGDSKKK
jgi:hypothetical protein